MGPTVKVPKLTQVSPWSEEDQVGRNRGELEKEKPSKGENVLQQQDTKSLIVDSLFYKSSLDDIHDVTERSSSEACNISNVKGTQQFDIKGIQRSHEYKSSPNKVLSLDYDALEILSSGEKPDQSCDLAQDEKNKTIGAGKFNYLKKI